MKISSLAINAGRAEKGAWVRDIPGLPGVEFKVRAFGNADHRMLQAKLIGAVPRAERIRGLSPEDQDRIDVECMVETVLLDWKGFETDDGAPLEFGKSVARQYLADPDYAIVRGGVTYAANVVADLGEDDIEADKGN